MQGGSWLAPLLVPWQPGWPARRTALRYFSQFPKKPCPKKPCRISSFLPSPGRIALGQGKPVPLPPHQPSSHLRVPAGTGGPSSPPHDSDPSSHAPKASYLEQSEKKSYCCFFFASHPRDSSLLRTPVPPPAGREAPVVRAAQAAERSPPEISPIGNRRRSRGLCPRPRSRLQTEGRCGRRRQLLVKAEGWSLCSIGAGRSRRSGGRVWGSLSGGRWR